ncbi:ABC transporter permease [Gilvimarinus agarilyticus]|uniref:ABC transporter permease n=1 Tax=unclassified Gilvimarinus TaxID=2642066 RepID=UPI001C09C9F2|nr:MULTISPECIES: ABC transporter permease [unclassified Gilvimarinus]MBU2886819.1 ABC transporter permease [Gilvimarinus agarilyticus]MDO6571483.1 ABC transporter permease [Gilvimarinus sp. 2_MG-2023]MDO6747336.1 ABC transporter permease [Gilvimarinus sp. 1_MG-2023]
MNINGQWVALSTLVRKEVRRFTRIWVQTLLPPVITMSLYFVIFGKLIGSRVGTMDGISYMQFVVPGLIMMAVLTNSYSNVVSSFFSAKFQRSIEELLVSPTPNVIILLGYCTGGMVRGLLVGALVTGVALFFTEIQVHSWPLTVTIILLTSLFFSLAGFLNAVFANTFDDISIVPTFILTPLTYLGGVFYSVSVLPDFWRYASQLNPILHMVEAFRYGLLGVGGEHVYWAFAGLIVCTAILFFIGLYLLKNGKRLRA